MSRTQFVEFAGRGFWAYDVALSVFLKHLIEAAETSSSKGLEPWLERVIPEWHGVIAVAGSGIGWKLGEGWSDAEVQAFLALVDQATHQLGRRERIDAEETSHWPAFEGVENLTRGAVTVTTAPIVELGQAVRTLVESSLPDPPEGLHWFFGTPDGRITL